MDLLVSILISALVSLLVVHQYAKWHERRTADRKLASVDFLAVLPDQQEEGVEGTQAVGLLEVDERGF